MSFKIEDNIVKVSKDCETCEHVKVCKFHSKMKELCNSNEFYGMNKYLEHNNSLRMFELHASCEHFKLNYDIPEDGSLSLKIDKNIINEIIKLEKPTGLSAYVVDIKNDIVIYRNANEEVNIKISDLLLKYKFLSK